MNVERWSWLVLVVALVPACDVPAPALDAAREAIVAGMDDDADPAVVGLRLPGGPVFCSGTLVSSRVVLTAAHCVVAASQNVEVFQGNVPDVDGQSLPTVDARTHPDYNPNGLVDDLGVILLAADSTVTPVYMRVPPLEMTDIGTQVRLVGFGHTAINDNTPARKREGLTTIAELTDQKFTYHPDPSLTCVGDSGGPGFIQDADGDWVLAGVTSSGDDQCMTFARDTRVDPHVGEFIQPYIAATSPGAAELGAVCFYDDNCASGMCLGADEDAHLRHCSRACTTDADCPIPGMNCASGACHYLVPTPGTLGTSCDDALECLSQKCIVVATGSICSEPCTVGSCADNFECQINDGGADGTGLCIPKHESGGCAMTGAVAPPPWTIFLLLAVVLRRRRAAVDR